MTEQLQRGGLGYKESPADIRDYKFKKAAVKLMANSFPETYECPIKTPIKNQGGVSSCVAHSAAEVLEYHYVEKTFSTNFIYGIHKKLYGSNGPGMFLREAAKIMKDYGDPEYNFCKGNTEVDDVYAIANEAFINPEAMNNAKKYRISKYARVSSVNDIKYALMNYGPVLGAIIWYVDNRMPNGVLERGTVIDGGHAIVVRGWNQEGWICQNSWGSLWGRKGYFILPYDYPLVEAYSIIPGEEGEPQDDIVTPTFADFIYKIINSVINFFRKILNI